MAGGAQEALQAMYNACRSWDEKVIPTDGQFGVITSVEPLVIKLDNDVIIDRDFLEVYQKIPRGASGCRVFVIKKRGGQKYLLPYTQFWR